MRTLLLYLSVGFFCSAQIEESSFHPAAVAGPQAEVEAASYPQPRIRALQNRRRSRVFREAGAAFDPPRLFRASGRFQKRVQSATTHDINSVILAPQDSIQIVSYSYDAENHHEKKMAEDKMNSFDAGEYAKGMERTTVAVKVREDVVETTTPMTNDIITDELQQQMQSDIPSQPKPRTFSQTVTANGGGGYDPNPPLLSHTPTSANQQRAVVFTPVPPQMPLAQPFAQPALGIGLQPNPIVPQNGPPPLVYQAVVSPASTAPITSPGLPRPDGMNAQSANVTLEQLGCGWDWLTNSCKDVFVLGWCGKCHDFGNVFLHDCKCVAPLIQLPKPPRQPALFWLF